MYFCQDLSFTKKKGETVKPQFLARFEWLQNQSLSNLDFDCSYRSVHQYNLSAGCLITIYWSVSTGVANKFRWSLSPLDGYSAVGKRTKSRASYILSSALPSASECVALGVLECQDMISGMCVYVCVCECVRGGGCVCVSTSWCDRCDCGACHNWMVSALDTSL